MIMKGFYITNPQLHIVPFRLHQLVKVQNSISFCVSWDTSQGPFDALMEHEDS